MAFVSLEGEKEGWRIGGGEVRDVTEEIVRRIWKRFLGVELPQRFGVMTYREAMNKVRCFSSEWEDEGLD